MMPIVIRRLLIVLCCFMSTTPAFATDRYFRDLSTTSPSGRWKLEAKSPVNAGKDPQPFASQFMFTFTDTQTGQVLWTRLQPSNEGSPTDLYVHDSMWVVVSTGYNELYWLAPATGEKRMQFNFLKEAFAESDLKYVHHTTAGEYWDQRSRWYFLEHADRIFFVIRAWWDKRFVVDLAGNRRIEQLDNDLASACDSAERAFVLKTLDGAQERIERAARDDYQPMLDTFTAVLLAGRMGIKEATPLLQVLQRSEYVGSSGGWFDYDDEYPPGQINPFNLSDLSLRQEVHLALRKLGAKPEELPCTSFSVETSSGSGERFVPAALPAPRATRVDRLAAGMTPRQVLDTLGAPDYVNFSEQAWEYDMDAEEPFTLRVRWKEKKTVDRWESISPPVWQVGDTRYEDLM